MTRHDSGVPQVWLLLFAVSLTTISARQPAAIAVDADDIGGVVRSSKGAEAGVWVIAETTDLPTKFVKIVVTDDQGRYLLPDLAEGQLLACGCAATAWWIRQRVTATPGKALNLTAVIAPNAHAAAQYYPAGYWFSLLRIPERGEFPGTGPHGNGINPEREEPGAVAAHDQVRRLHGLPSARHQGDARDSRGARQVPVAGARVGAAARVGPGRRQMMDGLNNLGQGARAAAVRRLDRSHQPRRAAAGAAAAAGRRAQRRDHDVGLGRSEGVPARRGVDRSAQPDAQRERPALRRARAERRLHAGARSEDQHASARSS